jgi:Arc/MetJ family transcription regulator
MPTNLALDDGLIAEAQRLGGHKTKKEAVTAALEDYIRMRLRKELIASFGTVDFDPDWDPKELRRRDLKRIPMWE